MIYFDNSATTRPLDDVIALVSSMLADCYANPSSLHALGLDAEKKRDAALETLAVASGSLASEWIVTSGGTESINMALRGYVEANPRAGRHLIASEGEHPAVLQTLSRLEKSGFDITLLPLEDRGCVSLERLERSIRPDPAMLSLFHINNETGATHPVADIVRIRDRVCPTMAIHLDSVQAFGKIDMPLNRIGCELVSISGHKFHATKGIGALYVRTGVRLAPLLYGGGQQRGLRSGTENIPMLAGMALAAQCAIAQTAETLPLKMRIRDRLLSALSTRVRYTVLSPDGSFPGILNVSFPDLPSETLLHALESESIYVSSGSACSSRNSQISPILQSMKIDPGLAKSAIRFSFSWDNTEEEAVRVADAVVRAVNRYVPKKGNR